MKQKEEEHHFEIAIAVPKRKAANNGAEDEDCAEVLVKEFKKAGFIVEIVPGLSDGFIKVHSLSCPIIYFY